MEIKVSEVMENTPMAKEEEGMFISRTPNCNDAFRRAMRLNDRLTEIQAMVNDIHIGNTEESWKSAYETLYTAFNECIAEEKKIAMR